jgi:hypothetical protein
VAYQRLLQNEEVDHIDLMSDTRDWRL